MFKILRLVALAVILGLALGFVQVKAADAHRTKSGHGHKAHAVKVWKAKKHGRTYRCVRYSRSSHRLTKCTILRPRLTHSQRVRASAVKYARSKVGQWYRYGGTGPVGFDCSGLIYAGYRQAGHFIPRTTFAQLAGLPHRSRLRAGDLVFAHRGHVALYIGHGKVIEAARTGTRIRYTVRSPRFMYATRSPF